MSCRQFDSASPKMRRALLIVASTALILPAAASGLATAGQLVTANQAGRHGLERAWYAQIPVDPNRSRVTSWYLYYDCIYGVTDSGIATALNAETGQQLWSKQVGKPGYPAFGPGANDKYIGIVSGAKLYILNRSDGQLFWSRELGSAPASGPALSNTTAFVALVTGRIEGYKLEDSAAQPWYYQSKGRTYIRPTVTGRVVSWSTAEGYLYVSRADDPGVLFRLKTKDDIVTSPAQQEPYIYTASLDGYLYCMNELTGEELWRFSTGYQIQSSPAIVGDHSYVASFEPRLYAIDAKTGQEVWSASGVSHFVARGKERVYAADRLGNLIILDGKTGSRLGHMNVSEGQSTIVNDQSDRLFLVSDRGLVQCLHDIGADAPTMYRQPPAPPADDAAKPTADESVASPFDSATPEAEAEEGPEAEVGADDARGVFEEEPAGDEPAAEEPAPADDMADEPAAEGADAEDIFGEP